MIKQDEDEKGNGDFEDSNGNPNHNNVKKIYIIYMIMMSPMRTMMMVRILTITPSQTSGKRRDITITR